MNLSRIHLAALVALLTPCLTAPLAAQGEKKEQEKEHADAQDSAAKKKAPLLEALMKASAEARPKALVAYIEDKISTNSFFTGQYDALKKVEGADKLVQTWIKTAPAIAHDETPFRQACIRALRDLHGKTAPEAVAKDLKSLATDPDEEQPIRQEASFALGQFGDRTFVDNIIKQSTKLTESDSAQQKAQGYNGLANVYYQIRDYEKAVAAYKAILGLHESGKISLGPRTSTFYYNCACSMSLGGMIDDAFEYLGKAMKQRVLGKRMLQEDMDIAALRKDPRFEKLMAKTFGLKKKSGGEKKHDDDKKKDKKKSKGPAK